MGPSSSAASCRSIQAKPPGFVGKRMDRIVYGPEQAGWASIRPGSLPAKERLGGAYWPRLPQQSGSSPGSQGRSGVPSEPGALWRVSVSSPSHPGFPTAIPHKRWPSRVCDLPPGGSPNLRRLLRAVTAELEIQKTERCRPQTLATRWRLSSEDRLPGRGPPLWRSVRNARKDTKPVMLSELPPPDCRC